MSPAEIVDLGVVVGSCWLAYDLGTDQFGSPDERRLLVKMCLGLALFGVVMFLVEIL